MKIRYAVAILALCLGINALGQPALTDVVVSYRLDPWLISGNYTGPLWVSPPVFGFVTQGGPSFVLQVRAEGLGIQGQIVPISAQWTPADPTMVTVSPGPGPQVTITVQRAGQSSLTVTSQGISKTLVVTGTLQGSALLVQIAQTQATAPPPPGPPPPAPPPSLTTTPDILTFAHQIGGAAPPAQTVDVASGGAGLPFTVSQNVPWVSVSPASGNATPASLSVSANPAGLAAGAHSGLITITSPGVATRAVTVILNVTAAPQPSLLVSPGTLSFSQPMGGPAPGPKSASVASSPSVAISFTAAVSSGANWLSVTRSSPTTPATLLVSVNASGLPVGTHTGTLTVSSADAANSLQTIDVSLTVTAPPSQPPPSPLPIGKLKFTFTVTDKQVNGSNLMVLDGSGEFGPRGVKGKGKFTEYRSADRQPASVVRHGKWEAKKLLMVTPATSMTLGANGVGMLVMDVALKPEEGREIPAVLKIEPSGVTLAVAGGATYAPTGAGSVAFTPAGDEKEKDKQKE